MEIGDKVIDTAKDFVIPIVERKISEVAARLKSLGYDVSGEWDLEKIREAVVAFQKMHGLKTDGEFGPKTERAMFAPKHGRCGLPDIFPNRSGVCKWPVMNVPLWPRLKLSGMTERQIVQAFANACEKWNRVCGINLSVTEDGSGALIVCDAGQGRRDQFDGAGGTLAWSYMPCGMRKSDLSVIQQKYDTAEPWNPEFLETVACHEIGHAIGIDHLEAGNLMAPYYDPRISEPQDGDAMEAFKRYGAPQNPQPKPEPKPEPKPPGNPEPPSVPDGESGLVGRVLVLRVEQVLPG